MLMVMGRAMAALSTRQVAQVLAALQVCMCMFVR